MLLDAIDKGVLGVVRLLYAHRSTDVVFATDLADLASKYSSFILQPVIDPQRIDVDLLRSVVESSKKSVYYISGPEPMVKGVAQLLEQLGIATDKVRKDFFPGYDWPDSSA